MPRITRAAAKYIDVIIMNRLQKSSKTHRQQQDVFINVIKLLVFFYIRIIKSKTLLPSYDEIMITMSLKFAIFC